MNPGIKSLKAGFDTCAITLVVVNAGIKSKQRRFVRGTAGLSSTSALPVSIIMPRSMIVGRLGWGHENLIGSSSVEHCYHNEIQNLIVVAFVSCVTYNKLRARLQKCSIEFN